METQGKENLELKWIADCSKCGETGDFVVNGLYNKRHMKRQNKKKVRGCGYFKLNPRILWTNAAVDDEEQIDCSLYDGLFVIYRKSNEATSLESECFQVGRISDYEYGGHMCCIRVFDYFLEENSLQATENYDLPHVTQIVNVLSYTTVQSSNSLAENIVQINSSDVPIVRKYLNQQSFVPTLSAVDIRSPSIGDEDKSCFRSLASLKRPISPHDGLVQDIQECMNKFDQIDEKNASKKVKCLQNNSPSPITTVGSCASTVNSTCRGLSPATLSSSSSKSASVLSSSSRLTTPTWLNQQSRIVNDEYNDLMKEILPSQSNSKWSPDAPIIHSCESCFVMFPNQESLDAHLKGSKRCLKMYKSLSNNYTKTDNKKTSKEGSQVCKANDSSSTHILLADPQVQFPSKGSSIGADVESIPSCLSGESTTSEHLPVSYTKDGIERTKEVSDERFSVTKRCSSSHILLADPQVRFPTEASNKTACLSDIQTGSATENISSPTMTKSSHKSEIFKRQSLPKNEPMRQFKGGPKSKASTTQSITTLSKKRAALPSLTSWTLTECQIKDADYLGVYFDITSQRYGAKLFTKDRDVVYQVPGDFDSNIEAAVARDELAMRLFGPDFTEGFNFRINPRQRMRYGSHLRDGQANIIAQLSNSNNDPEPVTKRPQKKIKIQKPKGKIKSIDASVEQVSQPSSDGFHKNVWDREALKIIQDTKIV